jgi:hypothetical protein
MNRPFWMICSKAVWKHTFVNPVRAVDVFVDALELRTSGSRGDQEIMFTTPLSSEQGYVPRQISDEYGAKLTQPIWSLFTRVNGRLVRKDELVWPLRSICRKSRQAQKDRV